MLFLKQTERIEGFYFRTDIIYTVPGKGDEMTMWTKKGKQNVCKHYLTMFYLDSCVS